MLLWLRFFRWPNLLIVALSMVLVRWWVVGPLLESPGFFSLHQVSFAGMVLATLLITMAGYVANDVVDREIDELNKPDRVFVGRIIPAEKAMTLSGGLLVAAALALIPLVRDLGFQGWMLLFPMSATLLLAYAFRFKCTPLVGNVVVSVLSGLVPVLVLLAEYAALDPGHVKRAVFVVGAYALFALTASFFREVIKDLQDAEGDETFGCRTLAVTNPTLAKRLAVEAGALLMLALPIFFWRLGASWPVWLGGIGGVVLPSGAAIWLSLQAQEAADYAVVSRLVKTILLAGLALLPFLVPAG